MILYANPGYNSLLKNYPYNTSEEAGVNNTITGTNIQLRPHEQYPLYESENIFSTYRYSMSFDFYRDKDGNKTYLPIVRLVTDNTTYKYIDLVLNNDDYSMSIYLSNSNDVLSIDNRKTVLTAEHLFCLDKLTNISMHVLLKTKDGKNPYIEIKFNNIEVYTVDLSTYYTENNIINTYIGNNSKDSSYYFSNIVTSNELDKSKKCMVVPIQIDSTSWTKNKDIYYADSPNQKINYSANVSDFNNKNYYIDNETNIYGIAMGSKKAYTDGNGNVKMLIDNVLLNTITLNKDKKGIITNIIEKNPSNDFTWNINSLSQADFTIQSE